MKTRAAEWFNRSRLRTLGTLAAVVLIVILLRQQGWEEILAALREIEAWRFALAFAFVFISRFMVTGRWHVLLRSAGVKVSPAQSIKLTFAGLFATNFLPTTVGGDVVRLAGALQMGLDAAVSAASLVMDRLLGMFGMAFMLPIGIQTIQAQTGMFSPMTISGIASAPAGAWPRKLWTRITNLARRTLRAVALWLKQPRALLASLSFTAGHMACFFGCLYVLLGGMGEQVSFWVIGGLYSLVYLITLVPISINGLGVQELSIATIFPLYAGISQHSGLALALLFRVLVMLASLPGALFLPAILPELKKRRNLEEETVG